MNRISILLILSASISIAPAYANSRDAEAISGCESFSLSHSKSLFSMAMKYYGTSQSSVSDSPESWASLATRACLSGYEAGKSGQPMSSLEKYMYMTASTFSDPFQYRAVSDALYWGYGKSMN